MIGTFLRKFSPDWRALADVSGRVTEGLATSTVTCNASGRVAGVYPRLWLRKTFRTPSPGGMTVKSIHAHPANFLHHTTELVYRVPLRAGWLTPLARRSASGPPLFPWKWSPLTHNAFLFGAHSLTDFALQKRTPHVQ